jgi:hypothetical protein
MIRSLFIRVDYEDPGRALRQEEAPGLWALTQDVARGINTRSVDEIRVTPGTEVAVYEKGNFAERMRDKGRRILILGVGVLNGFKQHGFRAVLAHEYGHLSHRDTAGGDVALRVNSDMIKFAQALALSGQAVALEYRLPVSARIPLHISPNQSRGDAASGSNGRPRSGAQLWRPSF